MLEIGMDYKQRTFKMWANFLRYIYRDVHVAHFECLQVLAWTGVGSSLSFWIIGAEWKDLAYVISLSHGFYHQVIKEI